MAHSIHLPLRDGRRPRTSTELPHRQLDQQPGDSQHVDAILAEAITWPSVLEQPSQISVEGGRALTLDDGTPAGPTEAFLIGREFCHVHAQGDRSLHAALSGISRDRRNLDRSRQFLTSDAPWLAEAGANGLFSGSDLAAPLDVSPPTDVGEPTAI